MIAIVHSIYSQSVYAPALDAGLMDTDAERQARQIRPNSGGGGVAEGHPRFDKGGVAIILFFFTR